jgi:ketosteroid isomerase-like protein
VSNYSSKAYGAESRDRRDKMQAHDFDGARAALESFYYALNHQDLEALAYNWTDDALAQLNNPLGGILRGRDAIRDLYDRILSGGVLVQVTFGDIVEYIGEDHALFAGRETGTYTVRRQEPRALAIRTSRYFRYSGRRWRQYHHHGSIDDPELLRSYQHAITGRQ